MTRIPFTYVAEGVLNGALEAVVGATVTFYEADGLTLLAQSLWNQPSGGVAQANPASTAANGATPTFWLDTQQTIVVKWTATNWQGVTETIAIGDAGAAAGALADGSVTTAKLADGAATGAKLGNDVLKTTTPLAGDVTGTHAANAIANGAVTTTKLATGAATGAALGSDVVTKAAGKVSPLSQVQEILSLNDLSDATVTSPTAGQVVKWNGTAWVNAAPAQRFGLPMPAPAVGNTGLGWAMYACTATELKILVTGGTSVQLNIQVNGANVLTTSPTVNASGTETTITAFDNPAIAAGAHLVLTVLTVTGSVSSVEVQLKAT